MSVIMLVDADQLPNTPTCFQDYVRQYFVKDTVLGKSVYHAATSPTGGRYYRGLAPSHSVDLMHYRDGLGEGERLSDWIRQAEGKILWHFYGASNECYHDDD